MSKSVKIGYAIGLLFALLSVAAGYLTYSRTGETSELWLGLMALIFVALYWGMGIYNVRNSERPGEKVKLQISIKSPVRLKQVGLESAYAKLIAIGLRISMRLGFIPVLIGKARSGKTLILEKTTPGNVFDNNGRTVDGVSGSYDWKMAEGFFSVDELIHFNIFTLERFFLDINHRTFAVSLQVTADFQRLGLAKLLENRKQLFIVLK